MESFETFETFKRANESAEEAPQAESGPDPVLVETNAALRNIVTELGAIDKGVDRVPVFQRMFKGPEVVADNPELLPFFDKIAAIEEKYGREAVAEIATLYGADRL